MSDGNRLEYRRRCCGAGALLLALLVSASPAAAQDHPGTATASFNAGLLNYSMENSGTAPFFAARWDMVLSRLAVTDLSLGYATPKRGEERTNLWIAEAQFQVRWPLGRISPFVGLGAGVAQDRPASDSEAERRNDATFSFGAGLRAELDRRTRLRSEVRFRGLDPGFDRTAVELTIGLGWVW